MSMHPKHDPKRRVAEPKGWRVIDYVIVIMIALMFAVVLFQPAEAALNCSADNSASLTPLYNQTIVNSASIPTGSVVVTMGESNWHHISEELRPRNDVTLINGADGGCAIGGIAKGRSDCWAKIPSNADVILLKPVNRSYGQPISAYESELEADTRKALEEIKKRRSNVSQVLLFAHHATPWAAPGNNGNPPKQGEHYSWYSGPVMQRVESNPPSGLGFTVTNAGYLWANGSYPRADGLQWSCDLFDNDGVHLSAEGNRIAALEVDRVLDNAIGGTAPPPDPDPEPQACEPTVPGQTCDVRERQGALWCICANPWSRTKL